MPFICFDVAFDEHGQLGGKGPGWRPEVAGLQENADDAGGESESVEKKNGSSSFVWASESEESDKEEQREASLEAEVEGKGCSVAEIAAVVEVDAVRSLHSYCNCR